MTKSSLFDQNLPGLARVHHALVRHRRGGGPAVQIQLLLGRSVPAVDGRGTGAMSPQQAERGKKKCYPHFRIEVIFVKNSSNSSIRSPTLVPAATASSTTARSATAARSARRTLAAAR